MRLGEFLFSNIKIKGNVFHFYMVTCYTVHIHYGTAMAAAVRIRSDLGLNFTPPPLGLELRSSQSLHQVLGTRATRTRNIANVPVQWLISAG